MAEIRSDIDVVLECVKCQLKSPTALHQSLMTLSGLFSSDEAKDYVRESGGLLYLYDLLRRTDFPNIKIATLFCLASATEKNVFSQTLLTQHGVFRVIHDSLHSVISSDKLRQAAVFLLLCLVANNSQSQNEARESGCLADLMGMFRYSSYGTQKLVSSGSSVITEARQFGLVTSALSVSINNPQNEENQRLCSTLLPHIFSLVMRVSEPQALCPVLSLVGVMVANNVFNQDRVKKCGGLDTLGSLLCNLSNRSTEEDCLTTAVQVVGALDSCLTDNEVNINKLGEVCGFGPLFSLLTPGLLSQQEQLQVVVTLSHVLQDNSGALAGVSAENYQQLVCLLTQAQDEELVKALKYVLHIIQDSECDKQTAQPEVKPNLK
ncbi:telomere repeats-binding bouquet formation protein 1-like [Haliotis rufescens]|uniref:telomere repeats-binding bouquet formation protein 1-like n=1 Tax=Haliotis rufescens TaxID=6454 RepID=UPI00201F2DEB|nr:telomere repeats-binding bouquet formation protein 1-like [Haliotis rufescens]